MSRLLLPLLLGTAAFGTAWWAGSITPAPAPAAASASKVPASTAVLDSGQNRPALSGLARRSAQLLRTENPDIRSIAALMTEPGTNSSEIFRMAKRWAAEDPAGFWDWLTHGGREQLKQMDVSGIVFEAWFRLDSAAALAAFHADHSKAKSAAASGLLQHLTGDDAALRAKLVPFLDEILAACGPSISFATKYPETVAKLMSLPPGTGRDTLLEKAGQSWLESDWKSASAWAATLTEPVRSKILTNQADTTFNAGISRIALRGQPNSLTEAECFEWAKQWFTTEATPDAKRKLGTAFVKKLAVTDPAAALDWAQNNLSARPLNLAMGTILKQQARKDPAAARALVEGLPPGGMKTRVAFEIAREPSPETVSWLRKEVDAGPHYQWSQLASNWASKDPAAYRAWLESAAADKLPIGLTYGVSKLVEEEGPGTMEWAVRTQSPATATQALQSWTEENAAAAVDWALQRPPGAARDAALATVRKSLDYSRIPDNERSTLQARLDKP